MNNLIIKEGHLTPFSISVTDEFGKPYDLSSYDQVKFYMANSLNEIEINGNEGKFVGDKSGGIISYEFQTGETDEIGQHKGYFSLFKDGNKIISVPDKYFIINIENNFID